MNNKEKETFESWYGEYFNIDGITILNIPHHFTNTWQAACEYKQKDIDKDKILILELSVENAYYFNLIAKLQAENAKLRECVEFYGEVFNWRDSGQDYGHGTIKPDDKEDLSEDDRVRLFGGKLARQVLKELELKNEKTQSEKLVDDLNTYAKQALKELDAKKGLKEQI